MLQLKGKGFFIWKIPSCEEGDPAAIASVAGQAGLSHVLIKIANGIYDFNYAGKKDLVLPVAQALKEKGIQVWGWHYVFGDLPKEEAKAALRQIHKIPLDGYVIDAESEYKDKYTPSRIFLKEIRTVLPDFPIALSSFRFPRYHPQLPWKDFLLKVDINMPQLYWEQAHNPDEQLERCLSEFQALLPFRPIIPTAPAYAANKWSPSPQDILTFMNTARDLNLSGVNFYSWDYCRSKLPQIWDTIAGYSWPGSTIPTKDVSEILIDELNNRNISKVIGLYASDAVYICPAYTIQGHNAIRNQYEKIILSQSNNYLFKVTGFSGKDNSRHFTWLVSSSDGKVLTGTDSLGLLNGKIIYHYSSFLS